jgi:predicted ATPase
MLLGPSLMFVLGQGATEVEQTYARALELGDRLSDPPASFTAAWGMWRLQFARADMRAASESALKCQQICADSADPVARLGTAFALGATSMFNGDCSTAAPHFEESIELYRAMQDKSALAVFGQDPGLSSMGYLAWARWTLGITDQAVATSEEAVQRARDIGKPVLIAVATGFAGMTHALRRDIAKLAEYAQESLSICEQYEFRQWAAMNNIAMACVHSNRGEHARAIALAGDGLEEKVSLGSYIALPWFCYLAADVYLSAGQMPEALKVARRGIQFAAKGDERYFESENHRIQAVILERDCAVSRDEIRARFDDALQLARQQKAKSLELRAATSFARFLAGQGDRDPARELLAPVYDSFTEGFDTPDLKEAESLLGEL